jgi:hypothetical protein
MQVRAGKPPAERPRRHLIAVLKGQEIVLQRRQRREAPERRAADGGDEPARQHFVAEIRQGPPASGTPASIGSSHAIRLISTTTLGGKAGWAPASRLRIKAGDALAEEAVAPLADNLSRRIRTGLYRVAQ